jgi:hypothetical protein
VPRPKAFTRSDVDSRDIVTIRRASAVAGPGFDATQKQIPNGTNNRGTEQSETRAIKAAVSLNQKLLAAGMSEAHTKEVERQVMLAFKSYDATLRVETQERPGRIAAALKGGLRPTMELRKWLVTLPPSLRLPLGTGGLEDQLDELLNRIKKQVGYWQTHVFQNRPKSVASSVLRKKLISIVTENAPDVADDRIQKHKRASKRNIERWVAITLAGAGIKFPEPKKNRKRFTGQQP